MKFSTNANHRLETTTTASISVFLISGALGSATATLCYANSSGNMEMFTDGTVAIGEQYELKHGIGLPVYLVISGANGTTDIDVISKPMN